MDEMVAGLAEARKSKGMTLEEARKILMDDSLFVAVMLVKMGVADGMVSGAIHSTADTLRPALQILKTAPGTELVSSFFIMVTKTPQYGDDGILLFADCALNQNPQPRRTGLHCRRFRKILQCFHRQGSKSCYAEPLHNGLRKAC